jgi:hypothetical protein
MNTTVTKANDEYIITIGTSFEWYATRKEAEELRDQLTEELQPVDWDNLEKMTDEMTSAPDIIEGTTMPSGHPITSVTGVE